MLHGTWGQKDKVFKASWGYMNLHLNRKKEKRLVINLKISYNKICRRKYHTTMILR